MAEQDELLPQSALTYENGVSQFSAENWLSPISALYRLKKDHPDRFSPISSVCCMPSRARREGETGGRRGPALPHRHGTGPTSLPRVEAVTRASSSHVIGPYLRNTG